MNPVSDIKTPLKRKRVQTDRYGYSDSDHVVRRPDFMKYDHSCIVKRIRPKITDEGYFWKELEVRKCNANKKNDPIYGVFAKKYLRPGLVIPILGHIIKRSKNTQATWTYGSDDTFQNTICNAFKPCRLGVLEGKKVSKNNKNIFKGIPDFGSGIFSMINQPTCKKEANCLFWRNYVLIADDIDENEELLVHYNDDDDENANANDVQTFKNDIGYARTIFKNVSADMIERMDKKLIKQMMRLNDTL